MFITHSTWQVEGVPRALLAPAIPWHSALLDISQPCFFVVPRLISEIPLFHVRLFSDIDQLLQYVIEESIEGCAVYALSRLGDELVISVVNAIGSYACPQTGIKLRVYFDKCEQARPAHSGQPDFSTQLTFDIEVSFT